MTIHILFERRRERKSSQYINLHAGIPTMKIDTDLYAIYQQQIRTSYLTHRGTIPSKE